MVPGFSNQVIIFTLCNYFLIISVVPLPLQESANSRPPNNEVQNNATKTLGNSWGDEIDSSESKISHANIVVTILNPAHHVANLIMTSTIIKNRNSSDTTSAQNLSAEKDGNNNNTVTDTTDGKENTDPNKKFFGLINVHLNNIIQINSKVNWTQDNVAYNINLLTHDSEKANINLAGFTSNYQSAQNNTGGSSDTSSSDGQRGHSEKGNSGGGGGTRGNGSGNGNGHVGYSLNIGNQDQQGEGTESDDLALPFDIQIPELQSMDDWIMKRNGAN